MKKVVFTALTTIALLAVLLIGAVVLTADNRAEETDFDPGMLRNAEETILTTGSSYAGEREVIQGRTFGAYVDKDGKTVVDINGTNLIVEVISATNGKGIEKSNVKDAPKQVLKVAERAKERLELYIDGSKVLQEKDVCEWMILHEMVHALSNRTNGGKEKQRYPYNLFNEILTDIVTASMNPAVGYGAKSYYQFVSEPVYSYIGIFGLDALRAYFYGYNSILAKIPEAELDIFVATLDSVVSEEASVIMNNCLNDWQVEFGGE